MPDALVGLAGPYDIRALLRTPRQPLPAEDADDATWDAANPVLLADPRPDVPVLLLHGDADEVVPAEFSSDFAAALTRRGTPGHADHPARRGPRRGLLGAGRGGAGIAEWLAGLPQD